MPLRVSGASAAPTDSARLQMENRGEQPPPVPFPDLEPVRKRAQASMARDLSVQLCRRSLEHVLYATQPPRTAAKLLKGAR